MVAGPFVFLPMRERKFVFPATFTGGHSMVPDAGILRRMEPGGVRHVDTVYQSQCLSFSGDVSGARYGLLLDGVR